MQLDLGNFSSLRRKQINVDRCGWAQETTLSKRALQHTRHLQLPYASEMGALHVAESVGSSIGHQFARAPGGAPGQPPTLSATHADPEYHWREVMDRHLDTSGPTFPRQ